MLSRRLAAALAMLAVFPEAAQADAPAPAPPPPAASEGNPAAKPASAKPGVEPVDKNQVVAILGRIVAGAEGQQVGRLTDVLVDGTGQPQAAVLDIGGFMGVGTRTIAVHWKTLHFAPWNDKTPITLDLSLEQIKAMPEYKGLATDKPAPVVVPPTAKSVAAH